MSADARPIAVMDSGVGGLSILRELRRQLPGEDMLYFADQGHVPYGPRPLAEIQSFVRSIARFFISREAKVMVIACNAASAGGLRHARQVFSQIPIVGMEPAIKPAAERTKSGIIGVITTKATYQGELFASVVDRFANGMEVVTAVCPDFVTLVEAGEFDTPAARQAAEGYLRPLIDAGIDQLVLGCTHFPFLAPVLREIVGPEVEIIDPGPAIARQVERVIGQNQNDEAHRGQVRYFTTSDPKRFYRLAAKLMNEPVGRQQVERLVWQDDHRLLSDVPATT